MAAIRERLTQLASLLLLVVAWAALARFIGTDILPTPARVLETLVPMVTSGRFIDPLLASLGRTVAGFALAFTAGIAYGIVAARSPRFALGTAGLFNVALFAPTLVIIFVGLMILGHGEILSIVLITGFAVFPSIAIYMRDVMKDIDQDALGMAKSFKVSRARQVVDIYLPYLTPPMLAASRIGFNMSWKVVMLCEVFGYPGGLGFQVRLSYTAFNLPALLAWLVVFVVALLVIEQIIRVTERTVVRWA